MARAKQGRQRIAVDSDRLPLRRGVKCRVVDQAATAAIGTVQLRVPTRNAATRMASAADHPVHSSTCGSPSCAVHPMAGEDTLAVAIAHRTMGDLVERQAIRGRVTAAALLGRPRATVAVAAPRAGEEDTTVVMVAVIPAAVVEATPAVVAGATPAVADMADIVRLNEQVEVDEVNDRGKKGVAERRALSLVARSRGFNHQVSMFQSA